MTVRLEVDPAFERTFRALENNGPARAAFLHSFGRAVQSIAQSRYLSGGAGSLRSQSGRLRASVTLDESGFPNTAQVGSDLIYAPVHEYGATIRARRADRLTFRLGSGEWRSPRSVTVPARPWLAPALDDTAARGEDLLLASLEGALR